MEPTPDGARTHPFLREGDQLFSELQGLPQDPGQRRARLANLRCRLAEVWLSLSDEELPLAAESRLWQATRVITVLLSNQALLPAEDQVFAKVLRALRETPSDRCVWAALPFFQQLGEEADRLFPAASAPVKRSLLPMLLYRDRDGSEEQQRSECRRLEALMDQFLAWLSEADAMEQKRFLTELKNWHSLEPFYFLEWDIPRVAAKRARLLQAVHASPELETAWRPAGPIPSDRRIRVGILARAFDARSETYALLPVFEHLDHARFETILLSQQEKGTPTETHCSSRVDRTLLLPKDMPALVAAIRALDLDILLFGNNLGSSLERLDAPLGLHRLARIQVNFVCSPITSALPEMDVFLLGEGSEAETGAASRYTERLVRLPGSGFCFSFAGRDEAPGRVLQRSDLGIRPGETVFVSGSNYFKLTPQVREAWSRILAAVPDSLLLLYPFGPAWLEVYPQELFVESMLEHFDRQGVARDRLVVVGAMKNVQEIRSLLRCGDIYLDAFPYSGATSLQDPLDVGLPLVVVEGRELRFRQGAALLREAGLDQLVASDPESYRKLAIRLGTDPAFRAEAAAEVKRVMAATPPFRDSRAYAEKVAGAFEGLVRDWNADWVRREERGLNAPSGPC